MKTKFIIVFAIIVFAELFFMNIESFYEFHNFTKPLIVGSLIAYFIPHGNHLNKQTKFYTLSALVFSVIGDMFLLNPDKFFTYGLIAFLFAHIMYILVFIKKRNPKTKPFGFIIIILLYGSIVFYFIKDGLGKFTIPVLIYIMVILTMAIFAFWRKETVNKQSYFLVLIGALFFILSDSLIAINKFSTPIPFSRTAIISTYAFAQLLLISGIIKQQ